MIERIMGETSLLAFLSIFIDGVGFLMSYFIGVHYKNFPGIPYVPFVSDLGSKSPNSSCFTLFLAFSIPFAFMVIERRFAQIKQNDTNETCPRLNVAAY